MRPPILGAFHNLCSYGVGIMSAENSIQCINCSFVIFVTIAFDFLRYNWDVNM